MGRATRKAFNTELSGLSAELDDKMREAGKSAGLTVTDAIQGVLRRRRNQITFTIAEMFSDRKVFDDFVRSTGDIDRGLGEVKKRLVEARENGALTGDEFKRLNLTMINWGRGLKTTEADRIKLNEDLRGM